MIKIILKYTTQKIEKLKILYPKGKDKFNEALRSASNCYKCYLVNSNQAKLEDVFSDAYNILLKLKPKSL